MLEVQVVAVALQFIVIYSINKRHPFVSFLVHTYVTSFTHDG